MWVILHAANCLVPACDTSPHVVVKNVWGGRPPGIEVEQGSVPVPSTLCDMLLYGQSDRRWGVQFGLVRYKHISERLTSTREGKAPPPSLPPRPTLFSSNLRLRAPCQVLGRATIVTCCRM